MKFYVRGLLQAAVLFLFSILIAHSLEAQTLVSNQLKADEITHWLANDPEVAKLSGAGKEDHELSPGERATRVMIEQFEAYLVDAVEYNETLFLPRLDPQNSTRENLFLYFSTFIRQSAEVTAIPHFDEPSLNGMAHSLQILARQHIFEQKGQDLNRIQQQNIMVIRDLMISAMAAGYRSPEEIAAIQLGSTQVDSDGKQIKMEQFLQMMIRYGIPVMGPDGQLAPYLQFWDLHSVTELQTAEQGSSERELRAYLQSESWMPGVEPPEAFVEVYIAENLDTGEIPRLDSAAPAVEVLKRKLAQLYMESPNLKPIQIQAELKKNEALAELSLRTRDIQKLWSQMGHLYYGALNEIKFSKNGPRQVARAHREMIASQTVRGIEKLVRARSQASHTHFDEFKDKLFTEIAEGRIEVPVDYISGSSAEAVQVLQVFAATLSAAQLASFGESTRAVLKSLASLSEEALERSATCTEAMVSVSKIINRPQ